MTSTGCGDRNTAEPDSELREPDDRSGADVVVGDVTTRLLSATASPVRLSRVILFSFYDEKQCSVTVRKLLSHSKFTYIGADFVEKMCFVSACFYMSWSRTGGCMPLDSDTQSTTSA